MTAEVAIINSLAVAIAADSAVTIGQGKKIYNSAIKVFSLSKVHPVGIMVYGNAGLLGVPWETIIKIYRTNLNTKSFATLEEYAADFLAYLPAQSHVFTDVLQSQWVLANIRGYFEAIREDLFSEAQGIIKANGGIDDAETKDLIKRVIKDHHDRLKKLEFTSTINKDDEKEISFKYDKDIEKTIEDIFQNLETGKASRSQLKSIACLIHTRQIFSESTSGVVVAGFGECDIYPSVCTHEIEGVLGNKLKYSYVDGKSHKIINSADCSIIPFAQDDMVASFMEGINPAVSRFLEQYLAQLFKRLPELLSDNELAGTDKEKVETKRKLSDGSRNLLHGFLKQISTHKRIKHIDPILSMVRVLPKDELAAMAESLVNLTAFKRRMTDSLETVGGPIDVAVISKGDGLVWVKRKHYFPQELNQQFFANYFRSIQSHSHARPLGDFE